DAPSYCSGLCPRQRVRIWSCPEKELKALNLARTKCAEAWYPRGCLRPKCMPSSSNKKLGESRNESARPITTGRRAAKRNILEVRPPAPGKHGGKAVRTVIEAEFLPLVAAAHEFKTPLVVMLGYTDLLHRGELGPINSKQREVLREMQEGTERLQKVIQSLLLLSELRSSNGQSPDTETAHATDVNENIKELFT